MIIEYFDDFEGPNPHAFLSNFYASPVTILGRTYPTGEHAFAAFKALPGTAAHERIRKALGPGTAKAFGRRIEMRPDWENVKYDVMRVVLRAKFAQGSELAAQLMATGNALLVEGTNWNDKVWGVALPGKRGRNWLGHLLMARRAELLSGEPETDETVALQFIGGK